MYLFYFYIACQALKSQVKILFPQNFKNIALLSFNFNTAIKRFGSVSPDLFM